jgi:hypothetical protein
MIYDEEAFWPKEVERHWRLCVRGALLDLRESMKRRRVLSLPNVLRLFELRWAREQRSSEIFRQGVRLGRIFLREFYEERQPLRGRKSRYLS